MYSLTKEKGKLTEKTLFVSSNDRDIKKWPNSDCFEIQLPEQFKNVTQLELISCQFRMYIHTFTQENQNLSFIFKVPRYTQAPIMCVISEGTYSMEEMAKAIEDALNVATTKQLLNTGWASENKSYISFEVKLGPSKKLEIHNRDDDFELYFEEQVAYKVDCKNQHTMWFYPNDWGLGYNLGFEKKNYGSIYDKFYERHLLRAPYVLILHTEKYIHMEIEKYNNMDELTPYSKATNNMVNNDYSGTVNKSFALIKIYNDLSIERDGQHWNSEPVLKLKTPESISKLKFKFRDHLGNPVNFENQPFSFQIRFQMYM